jgi:hypothetical protein
MSTATLAGHHVTHARVHLPAWGVPWAEVSIDNEAALAGTVTLALADLTFAGRVMSGGTGPVGRASYRLAAGAGMWGKTIPPVSYANDAGVKALTALLDAARACGETLDPATLPGPDVRLGPAWTRETGPAGRTLELIAPQAWFVGTDGITRLGRRPASVLATPATVIGVDRARRTVTLAAEAIAALVPGVTAEGIQAVDVLHELTPTGLRTTLWGSGTADTNRRMMALRRIFEQLDPDRRFRGVYEYRVVSQTPGGTRLNLQPVRVATGMPDLQVVPVRPGIPGARSDVAPGARVLVGFVDASPARPVVVGFEDADGSGFVPQTLTLNATAQIILGAGGVLPAARFSDPVIAGPFGGTITGGSTKTRVA